MAAGDITKALETKVRTLLDEDTAGFYTADMVYKSLADAQREIATFFLSVFKAKQKLNKDEECPNVLRPILSTTTSATGTQNLPADFWDVLFIKDSSANVPIRIRNMSANYPHKLANTYLASSASQPYCYISGSQVVLETSMSWTMTYFKTLTDTSGSVDPFLAQSSYNAMVQYAFADLLRRDEDPRAGEEFNKFLKMLQDIT